MAKEYFEVDENGHILDNHLLEDEAEIPSGWVQGWGDKVLYEPKWDSVIGEWVEGASSEHINEITNPRTPPSIEERLAAMEMAFLDMMM